MVLVSTIAARPTKRRGDAAESSRSPLALASTACLDAPAQRVLSLGGRDPGPSAFVVVVVILYHAWLGAYAGGNIGVDVFFVVSGY